MSDYKINWKTVALYGLLVGTIILLALYLFNIQPVHSFGDLIIGKVSGLFSNPAISSAINYLKANWVSLGLATVIPATGLITGLIYKIKAGQQEAAKEEMAQKASDELNKRLNAESQINQLNNKIDSYENDPTAGDLQTRLSTVLDENGAKDVQIQTLQQELDKARKDLQNTPVKIVTVNK